jgi:glycosyltransferase involved in cell wall biosynthesis
MIVGIDNISPGASTSLSTIGGMRAYLEDLLEYLPALRREWIFKLFTPAGSFSESNSLADNIHIISCEVIPFHRAGRVLYEQIMLPRLIHKEKLDIWLGTCNVLPLMCPCLSVVIVQSLQYFSFPSAYSPLRRHYLRFLGALSARRANRIIALSYAERDMILSRFHLHDDKVVVAQNGLSRALCKQLNAPETDRATKHIQQLTSGRPYLLSVSAFYEYKNLTRLIRAFAQVSSVVTHQMVLVGAETPQITTDFLKNLADQLGIQDRIVFAGHLPHDEVAAFYRHADAAIMPSLEETFGLPIAEAMSLGCPVITSNVGSMTEIAGDAAQFVDPRSINDIAVGIQRVLNDADYRDKLRVRGFQQAAKFTNNRSVDIIASVLDTMINAHSHH